MRAFSHFNFETLIALTTIVSIPKGPMATIILSAQPVDTLKNCFVAWSPKSARSGARSLTKLVAKSSAPKEVAVAAGAAVVVVVAILISASES